MMKIEKSVIIFLFLLILCVMSPQAVLAEGLPMVTLEPIATGLADPLGIVDAGDSSGRLFIVLQAGQIVIINGTEILDPPFLSSMFVSGCVVAVSGACLD